MMVQPALIVVDSRGAVVQTWSWMLMGLESPAAASNVPNPDPSHPLTEVRLVTVRPVPSDIGPSVADGRPVQLQAHLPEGWKSNAFWNTELTPDALRKRIAEKDPNFT